MGRDQRRRTFVDQPQQHGFPRRTDAALSTVDCKTKHKQRQGELHKGKSCLPTPLCFAYSPICMTMMHETLS